MTNQEAIEILKDLWRYEHSKFSEKEIREALEKGIEALQNPCKACDYFAEDIYSYCRKDEGVLDQIAEKQKTLLDSTKAWNDYIDKNGDIY